jgi:hypothetical protein
MLDPVSVLTALIGAVFAGVLVGAFLLLPSLLSR